MGALTGSTISSSYDMLLKTATTGGVTSTLKVIEDGLGVDSALQLSTTVVSVDGEFQSTGDCLLLGGTLRIKDSGNTTQRGAIYGDADDFSIVAGVNNLKLSSAGGLAMTIDASKNVGIGGTPTSRTFEVFGTAEVKNTGGGANFYIQGGTADADASIWFVENGTAKSGVYHDASADALVLQDGAATDTVWVNGGNVGIGGTPKTKLDVIVSAVTGYSSVQNDGIVIERAGATAALNIATDNDQQGAIWFADGDAANSGQIIYDHDDDSLQLGTAATEAMRIDSSGNVGIGASTVQAKLDVSTGGQNADAGYNAQNAALNLIYEGGPDTDDEGQGVFFSQQYSTADPTSYVRTGAVLGYKQTADGSFGGGLKFKIQPTGATAMSEAMRIDSSGNVIIASIPTSDPSIAGALWSDSGTVKISAG